MKKGFTLMELLIVMVIVTILVLISVPKYKATMERGRGMEAFTNTQAVSDAVNAYYIMNGNSYESNNGLSDSANLCYYAEGSNNCQSADGVAGLIRSTFFNYPQIDVGAGSVTVTTTSGDTNGDNRLGGGKDYSIVFVNENGETKERYCKCKESGTNCKAYCNVLGAGKDRSGGGWSF